MMNYALKIKKKKTQPPFPFGLNLPPPPFLVWVPFLRPTAKTRLLFRHHSRKSKFSSPVTMFFKKFSSVFARSTNTLLTSTRCMPKCSVRSHDTWFLKFQFPLLPHERSNDDWHESLSELFGRFLHFWMLKVVLNVRVLLMASSPNACFNVSKVSENVFPNLKQNFTQTRCSGNSPILNSRKIRRASKTHVHS